MRRVDTEPDCPPGKYLLFRLGQGTFGVEILSVREIIGLPTITQVPRASECIRGVINLRGRITPILDTAVRLSVERSPDTERTCIVIVATRQNDIDVRVGLIVEEVLEVVEIEASDFSSSELVGKYADRALLEGLARPGGRIVGVLDVDRLIDVEGCDAAPDVDSDAASDPQPQLENQGQCTE